MSPDAKKRREIDLAGLRGAEREQQVLAQELHDGLCQSLVGVSLLVRTLGRSNNETLAGKPELLQQINEALDTAIEQSRTLMQAHVLSRQPDLLPELLGKLARAINARVPCEFTYSGEVHNLDSSRAHALYRVARETLQNIVREAQATKIKVELTGTTREMELQIRHDGRKAQNDDSSPIFEGDSFTRRFAEAVGLTWTTEEQKSGPVLRCKTSHR